MNQFKNKVLYIESNEMLEEVRELIEKVGKKNILPPNIFFIKKRICYVSFSDFQNVFKLSIKFPFESEITLEEFKELLKQG